MSGYQTREEAIEAWNTWRGRYTLPDRISFLKANPCNRCGQFVDDDGFFVMCDGGEIFGSAAIFDDGTFTTTWPLLPYSYKNNMTDEAIELSLKCRARWGALFRDVNDYRNKIAKLIMSNDKKNEIVNANILIWNEYLNTHGFLPFAENDLRGINLSGLVLSGKDYAGVNLSKLDLSYSELSMADLTGANLYGSKLDYCQGHFCILNNAIINNGSMANSHFSSSSLAGSDLFSVNLDASFFYNTNFSGTNISNATISGARFTNINTDDWATSNPIKPIVKFCAENVTGDSKTEAPFDYKQDGAKMGLVKRIWKAIEIKPGVAGVSIDVKQIFRKRK